MKIIGHGEKVSQLLKVALPCGGNGKCGKCRVKIRGEISPVTPVERRLLSETELDGGIRLACECGVLGEADAEYIGEKLKTGLTDGDFLGSFSIKPVSGEKRCVAAAFDIGTTTVAYYIYNLPEGKKIEAGCFENPQRRFGSDVISRISYSDKNGINELTNEIRAAVDKVKTRFKPEFSVVTGNTIMLHYYTGLDPHGIASYPFTPESLFGNWVGEDYIPRCMSPYIGADVACAVLASGMMKDEAAVMVDFGTNAEIAFWDGKKLRCASSAAGPCFEGYGIKHGMPASSGAICRAFTVNGRICYETINSKPPIGFCGSGIIDSVACMLDVGAISENGLLEEDFCIGNVCITQNDIRQLQTAKAAVFAGIKTVTENSEAIPVRFYTAGGFGASLNPKSAAKIGLIPREYSDKCISLGNASGTGACMMLLDKSLMNSTEIPAEIIELSGNERFSEYFIKSMGFNL